MPTTKQEFKSLVMDKMVDKSKLLWADNENGKKERTMIFTTAHVLTILSLCSKASVVGNFSSCQSNLLLLQF